MSSFLQKAQQKEATQSATTTTTATVNRKSEIDVNSVALVHGFCRETEKLLLSFQSLIPAGISGVIFSYFYLQYFYKHLLLENPTQAQKLESVIGLKEAIASCKETIILPFLFPQLFTGQRRPYTGIVLFGPRGCGKSTLIRAVVSETLTHQKYKKVNAKCFSVSIPRLMQALRDPNVDDTELMIRQMFQITADMQQEDACTILWMDEMHKLFSRCGTESASDSSSQLMRGAKIEFLVQLDAIAHDRQKKLLVIAETNEPWKLDCVFRRRFQKRIYVGMPTKEDRIKRETHSITNNITGGQYSNLGDKTEGFSGQEIGAMIADAMNELMKNMNLRDFHEVMLTEEAILNVLMNMKPMNGEEYLKQMEVWREDFGY